MRFFSTVRSFENPSNLEAVLGKAVAFEKQDQGEGETRIENRNFSATNCLIRAGGENPGGVFFSLLLHFLPASATKESNAWEKREKANKRKQFQRAGVYCILE
ncbi:hypothetical protein B9Z55_004086 [Caenorhabditis nigoni]|uniref:Uncharacterized protein n=1 Tax=Caenorhabditis nigoni TaxID=1611254 RepID=A0A2G5UVP7_9PELO|nr:hypothetical protein B9Z55_004086 [Caenorhabditis nigoni]